MTKKSKTGRSRTNEKRSWIQKEEFKHSEELLKALLLLSSELKEYTKILLNEFKKILELSFSCAYFIGSDCRYYFNPFVTTQRKFKCSTIPYVKHHSHIHIQNYSYGGRQYNYNSRRRPMLLQKIGIYAAKYFLSSDFFFVFSFCQGTFGFSPLMGTRVTSLIWGLMGIRGGLNL